MESFNRKIEKQPQMRNRELKMLATEIVEKNLLYLFQKMIALLIEKIGRNQQLIREASHSSERNFVMNCASQ